MIQRGDVVIYPESDGAPTAESMLQRRWMDRLITGLRSAYRGRDVVVVGDMFWYPVRGEPDTRFAPDVMVVFGRPMYDRPSWLQWEEAGVGPQVVFEVLSPSNTAEEMALKRADYERFGVEEYYEIEPELPSARGWLRQGGRLVELPSLSGWLSPRLGVRVEARPGSLRFFGPSGREFLDPDVIDARAETFEHERDAAVAGREALREQLAARDREIEALREQLRRLGGAPSERGTA